MSEFAVRQLVIPADPDHIKAPPPSAQTKRKYPEIHVFSYYIFRKYEQNVVVHVLYIPSQLTFDKITQSHNLYTPYTLTFDTDE